jgi:MarR family transcriptional regulator, 2-MHQ and catechol-resistance regulon repressor
MATHYKGRQKEVRALDAYIALARAAQSVAAKAGAHTASRGLTLGQFGVLEALLHRGPLSQTELCRKLLRSGGNMTMVLDHLERDGWIRRERLKSDRRTIQVSLTTTGRKLIEGIFPEHAAMIAALFHVLTAAEQEQLRRLCRKLGLSVQGEVETTNREKRQ